MTTHQANGWNFTLREDGSVTVSRERGLPVAITFDARQWAEIVGATTTKDRGFITAFSLDPMAAVASGAQAFAPTECACTCGYRGQTPCPQHGGR